ncbi:hypothetical protein EDC94DRAFT_603031 [Helicostylum pulchrum]|nr:hypothetical protein EDC94DRAFT_603031 [Helicostylum pulchrum]
MDSHQNEQEEQKIYTYPNLKELTLNNFTPKKDGEMLTLIKNLTHLKKLNIIGDEKALWPSDTVDPTITGIFFDTFSLVPEYLIEVTGKSQVTALMNKWSRVKKKTSQEIHLSFKFNSGNIQPISLAIEESSSNPIIRLRYKGLAHSEEFNSFIWIGDTVSKVEYIDSSMNNRGIAERIIALLGEEHVNLKTLILTNCVFTFNTFPNTLPPEKQHLKKLEFCNCTFDLPVLMSFLTQFDSLDFVGFGYCIFKSIIYDEPINMSKTSIGTMRISNPTCEEKVRSNNRSNHRLVTNCNTNYQTHVRAASVYSSAENLTRFYIIIDDNAVEATQASFNSILTQFKLNITVIRLKVYSIEELLLKSVNSSGYIEIISPD